MKKTIILAAIVAAFSAHSQTFKLVSGDSLDIRDIAIDKTNNKWMATGSGIVKYDGKKFTSLTTTNGLINDDVTTIALDKSGNVWAGTTMGVSKYDGSTWTNYTKTEGLVNNNIRDIAVDKSGNVWFATNGGVSKYNGSWTNYTVTDGLPNNSVTTIAFDSLQNTWFGTSLGLSKFNGTSFTNFSQTNNSLVSDVITSVCVDRLNKVWVGTFNGASSIASLQTATENYTDTSIIYITDVQAQINGTIWFSRYDSYKFIGSIAKYSTNTWKTIVLGANVSPTRIAIDDSGTVWVATVSGLYKSSTETTIGTTAQNENIHEKISVYPNPAKNSIQLQGLATENQIKVFNAQGQLIIQENNNHGVINIETLSSGIYNINILSNNHYSTQKLIVN